MTKIIPDILYVAGHSNTDPGAIAYNGKAEAQYTKEFTELIKKYHEESIKQKEGTVITDNNNNSLWKVINSINNEDKLIGMDIHFNFNHYSATGTEAFVHPNTSLYNKKRATEILTAINKISGLKIRKGGRWPNTRTFKYPNESHVGTLGIVESTRWPMILLEVCFLNEKDLNVYEKYKHELAKKIANINEVYQKLI